MQFYTVRRKDPMHLYYSLKLI